MIKSLPKIPLPGDGERIYAKLVNGISRELLRAISYEAKNHGLTRAILANAMNKDKAYVSKRLKGSNMTLRVIASFLGAIGWELEVKAHRIAKDGEVEKISNIRSDIEAKMFQEITPTSTGSARGPLSSDGSRSWGDSVAVLEDAKQ